MPLEPLIGRVVAQLFECGRAGGHGERVAGERSRLKHLAGREHVVHHVAAAAVGPERQPAPHDLAERGEIGRDAENLLRPTE